MTYSPVVTVMYKGFKLNGFSHTGDDCQTTKQSVKQSCMKIIFTVDHLRMVGLAKLG